MLSLSIGRKIFYGFSVIILLAVAIFLISYPSLSKISALSFLVTPLEREANISQKFSEITTLLENKIEIYLMVGSQAARDEVVAASKQLDQLSKEIVREKDLKNLREIAALTGQISDAAGTLVDYIDSGESAYKINKRLSIAVNLIQKFEEAQKTLQRQNLEQSLAIVTEQKAIINALLRMFIILEIAIIVFGLLACLLLTRLITRNLFALQKATREIALGNFEARVSLSSNDEIGQLANSFNAMLDELRKSTVSKDYLGNIINSMADMLVVTDPQLKILRINKAVSELLGYAEDELRGEPVTKIFSSAHALFKEKRFEQRVRNGGFFNYEMYYCGKDGQDIPVLFSVSVVEDKAGSTGYIICTAQDITVLKKAEQRLRALSLTDHLTGLYNRRGFLIIGEQQIKVAKRNRDNLALFFTDVDNMKWINDTFGHAEGDAAIIEVANIMKGTVRSPDIIARIGGDEFVILATQAMRKEGDMLIKRLKEKLEARNTGYGNRYHLALSIGAAYCQAPYLGSIDDLLVQADKLMYEQKKKNGLNGHGVV